MEEATHNSTPAPLPSAIWNSIKIKKINWLREMKSIYYYGMKFNWLFEWSGNEAQQSMNGMESKERINQTKEMRRLGWLVSLVGYERRAPSAAGPFHSNKLCSRLFSFQLPCLELSFLRSIWWNWAAECLLIWFVFL